MLRTHCLVGFAVVLFCALADGNRAAAQTIQFGGASSIIGDPLFDGQIGAEQVIQWNGVNSIGGSFGSSGTLVNQGIGATLTSVGAESLVLTTRSIGSTATPPLVTTASSSPNILGVTNARFDSAESESWSFDFDQDVVLKHLVFSALDFDGETIGLSAPGLDPMSFTRTDMTMASVTYGASTNNRFVYTPELGGLPVAAGDDVSIAANQGSWGLQAVVVEIAPSLSGVVLQVDITTGALVLENRSGLDLPIDYYEITGSGSLDGAAWASLQDQDTPAFPAGNGSGNGWEVLGDPLALGAGGETKLAEGFLLGDSAFPNGGSIALGEAFRVGSTQDLGVRVRLSNGELLEGIIEEIETADGDYNDDGVVDAADYTLWRDGATPYSTPNGYNLWRMDFGREIPEGAAAVPEPGAATLLGCCLAVAGLVRRRYRKLCAPAKQRCAPMPGQQERSPVLGYVVVVVAASFVFLLSAPSFANGPDRSRPNIVLFYADDLGIGDTSAYADLGNNPDNYQISTPNIERLAGMGTRFTDVHSSAPICSPSRVSLLTGRYSFRSDLKHKVTQSSVVIDRTVLTQGGKTSRTLGNLLGDAGYRNYGIGKWHLGLGLDSDSIETSRTLLEGPTHVGFDRYVGNAGNPGGKGEMIEDDQFVKFASTSPNDLTTVTLTGTDTPSTNWEVNGDGGALQHAKLTQRHLDASKGFLQDHTSGGSFDQQPFFLYYASHNPHTPYYAPDFIQTDANGTPTAVPVTGNTVAGGPIVVQTGPDNNNDGLPDPIDPLYPSTVFNGTSSWSRYYEEDAFGNQISNPAAARAELVHADDIVLGELIDFLETNDDPRNPGGKLIDNTLIIFTSDNGANIDGPGVGGLTESGTGDAVDLGGKKSSKLEGGTRVPFIAAWAGEVQEGLTSNALFGQHDLYATFAEITQQQLEPTYADTEGADSESVLSALQGTEFGSVRDSGLIYKRFGQLIIRRGDLKLIVAEADYDDEGLRVDPGGLSSGLDWQDLVIESLHDLSVDLDEQTNLANDPAWASVRDSMFAELVAAIGPDAESGFTRGLVGDLNHDMQVDISDWQLFRAGFGGDYSASTGLAAYLSGDMDGDNDVDVDDFGLFKAAFDLANGAGAFAATTAVPEPCALLILLTMAPIATPRRQRPSSKAVH